MTLDWAPRTCCATQSSQTRLTQAGPRREGPHRLLGSWSSALCTTGLRLFSRAAADASSAHTTYTTAIDFRRRRHALRSMLAKDVSSRDRACGDPKMVYRSGLMTNFAVWGHAGPSISTKPDLGARTALSARSDPVERQEPTCQQLQPLSTGPKTRPAKLNRKMVRFASQVMSRWKDPGPKG